MSHAPAFGTVALLMWLWLRPARSGTRRAALLGAASGLAALVQWSNGLVVLMPILYLGAIGLFLLVRREPLRGFAAIALFAALTRLNAGVAAWSGSAAFGARRFEAVLPLLGLGMALAIDAGARLSRRRPLVLPGALVAGLIAWNLGLAKSFYTPVWNASAPVTFEQMGHGFVSQIDRLMGSPFSLPASLAEWARSGRHPAEYESLFMTRPHSRWTTRMGVDDRLFLEDGWSAPLSIEGTRCRLLIGRSAGLVVPLHKARPSRFGARLIATGGDEAALPVKVMLNERRVGRWFVTGGWRDYWLEVDSQALKAGRNDIRLRQAARGTRRLAVAGTWLEPRQ